MNPLSTPRRRGRPPKIARSEADTRLALIRCGLELLTEQGFKATGLEQLLKRVAVPKGSFYHYFESKEAFGQVLLAEYGEFFARKLRRILHNPARNPLERIEDLLAESIAGMARHQWRRGCLVGNLGQEITVLPVSFRSQLEQLLAVWQGLLAGCLHEAQAQGLVASEVDCDAQAAFFWIGWEGAVMRARLSENGQPLTIFIQGFLNGLTR